MQPEYCANIWEILEKYNIMVEMPVAKRVQEAPATTYILNIFKYIFICILRKGATYDKL